MKKSVLITSIGYLLTGHAAALPNPNPPPQKNLSPYQLNIRYKIQCTQRKNMRWQQILDRTLHFLKTSDGTADDELTNYLTFLTSFGQDLSKQILIEQIYTQPISHIQPNPPLIFLYQKLLPFSDTLTFNFTVTRSEDPRIQNMWLRLLETYNTLHLMLSNTKDTNISADTHTHLFRCYAQALCLSQHVGITTDYSFDIEGQSPLRELLELQEPTADLIDSID